MKFLIIPVLSLAALIVLLAPIFGMIQTRTKAVNCQLAEISPDFSNEMRQQCRKLRQ